MKDEKDNLRSKKIRVLITKVGLDSHDRGAKVVSTALREAGIEAIYLGRFQTPEGIVRAALQEDVDVIGVSCHCGEHLSLVPQILSLLKENKAEHLPLILGGVIPKEDIPDLKALGVKEVFLSGSDSEEISRFVREVVSNRPD